MHSATVGVGTPGMWRLAPCARATTRWTCVRAIPLPRLLRSTRLFSTFAGIMPMWLM